VSTKESGISISYISTADSVGVPPSKLTDRLKKRT